MSRLIVVALAVLGLLQAAATIDLSQSKNIQVDFTQDDIVPKTAVKSLTPENQAAAGFIGNFEVGSRYPDETVFRRDLVFNNPTSTVQSSTLTITINNGILHYLYVENKSGSYAVICGEPNTIGSYRGNITIRAGPYSKSYLTLVAAAH